MRLPVGEALGFEAQRACKSPDARGRVDPGVRYHVVLIYSSTVVILTLRGRCTGRPGPPRVVRNGVDDRIGSARYVLRIDTERLTDIPRGKLLYLRVPGYGRERTARGFPHRVLALIANLNAAVLG